MNLLELRKKGCLSNWFPLIEAAGLPVPKTTIIKTGTMEPAALLDGETPEGFADFELAVKMAASKYGLPCFLRTGQTSNKHGWKNSCFLANLKYLRSHILHLVEFSECVDLFGLPYDVWAVRELLPTKPIFEYWAGLPITKERRYFAKDGKVICHHPYWPPIVFPDLTHLKEAKLSELNFESAAEIAELSKLAETASAVLEGAWSIDFLDTEKGWYLIDAAPAEGSWHWPGCEQITTTNNF